MKLEIGYNASFEVRTEQCFSNCTAAFSVLYLSDLHLNRHGGALVQSLLTTIESLDPTIILFGGDYVDSSTGRVHLETLLRGLAGRKNGFAIAGNHDVFWGTSKIQKLFSMHGFVWLSEEPVFIDLGDTRVKISPHFKVPPPQERADFSILVLHQPADFSSFKYRYQLAFAGHLHGCQAVFWKRGENLFPGRLFYKWNRLKGGSSDCHYYISKGLGDTVPIRYNCAKDVLFVQVLNSPSPL